MLDDKDKEVSIAKEELGNFKKFMKRDKSIEDFEHVSRVIEEKSALVVKNEGLVQEIFDIQEDLENKIRELGSAERIIQSLSKELEDKDTSMQQVSEEIEIFLKEKNYLIESNEDLKEEIEVHKEANSELIEKIEELEEKINEMDLKNKMEIEDKENQNEDAVRLDQLKSANKELQTRIMDMERMVLKEKENRIELEQKASDCNELEKRNVDLISKISVLENQLIFHKSNPRSKSISSNNHFISETMQSRKKPKSNLKDRKGFSDSKAAHRNRNKQRSINFKDEITTEEQGKSQVGSNRRHGSDSVREMVKEYSGIDWKKKKELELKIKKDRKSGNWKQTYLHDPKVFSMNSQIIQNMIDPINKKHRRKTQQTHNNPKHNSTYNVQRRLFENKIKNF